MKFSLDKFSNVIGRYPIKIETDCKALCDTIVNNKLNATHTRWLDGIMGHHIVDCCHRLGHENQAADGISHQFTDTPQVQGDGHDWSVDPSWEANMGLAYNIWTIQLDSEQTALWERFTNEPIFLDVIDAMHNVDHGRTSIGCAIVCWDIRLKMGVCIELAMGSPLAQGHVWNV